MTKYDAKMRPSAYGVAAPNYGPKAWCYLCTEQHLWLYPCEQLLRLRWAKRSLAKTKEQVA